MAQQIFDFSQVAPARNIECIYVWLAKENEDDLFCRYSFTAEVYRRSALSKHLAAVRSENGMIEIDKSRDHFGIRCTSAEKPGSICDQVLSELQDSLQQRNYPSSRFLAFCNPLSG